MRSSPLVIQGDFTPAQDPRLLKILVRGSLVLLGLALLVSLVFYGINVHYQNQMNEVSKETRDLFEENKVLQIRLNRIRSYKNVEAAAKAVPNLVLPTDVVEVSGRKTTLPAMPPRKGELPRAYGY